MAVPHLAMYDLVELHLAILHLAVLHLRVISPARKLAFVQIIKRDILFCLWVVKGIDSRRTSLILNMLNIDWLSLVRHAGHNWRPRYLLRSVLIHVNIPLRMSCGLQFFDLAVRFLASRLT